MERQLYDIGIRVPFLVSAKNSTEIKGHDFQVEVLHDQFIGVTGTKISRVCSWLEFEREPSARASVGKWIDASHHVLLPGLVNAHTHLPMSLFRGLADDAPLQQWLQDIIFPLEAALAHEKFCEVGTELSLLESIRFGTTTFGDMYFQQKAISLAVEKAGVRAVLAETVIDFPTTDNPMVDDSSYRIFHELREKFQSHDKVEIALGPHAPYTCSDDTLRRVNSTSLETGAKILIHVSETIGEVSESLRLYGKTPIARLMDLGVLRRGVSIAHAVHLNEADRKILALSGASVVHNPESNMKLGCGIAPIIDYLKHHIPVGLGTDGAASNNCLNLFSEMDSAAKLQKLAANDNTAMTAASALYIATLGGARALGLGDRTGSIEVGKEADLILMSLDHPHMQPTHDLLSLLVYSATGLEVETVLCGGKVLFEKNEWKTIDRERTLNGVLDQSQKIQAFLQKSGPQSV